MKNKMLCKMGNRASLQHCINHQYRVQKGVETGKRVDPKYGLGDMEVWAERCLPEYGQHGKSKQGMFWVLFLFCFDFTVSNNTDHMT